MYGDDFKSILIPSQYLWRKLDLSEDMDCQVLALRGVWSALNGRSNGQGLIQRLAIRYLYYKAPCLLLGKPASVRSITVNRWKEETVTSLHWLGREAPPRRLIVLG